MSDKKESPRYRVGDLVSFEELSENPVMLFTSVQLDTQQKLWRPSSAVVVAVPRGAPILIIDLVCYWNGVIKGQPNAYIFLAEEKIGLCPINYLDYHTTLVKASTLEPSDALNSVHDAIFTVR